MEYINNIIEYYDELYSVSTEQKKLYEDLKNGNVVYYSSASTTVSLNKRSYELMYNDFAAYNEISFPGYVKLKDGISGLIDKNGTDTVDPSEKPYNFNPVEYKDGNYNN